ncbi:MAG: efflux RND transporter periplasmic adaptor subunit, partial [Pseudomonadota bacterium]
RVLEASGLRDRASSTRVAVRLIDEADFSHEGSIDFVDNRIDRLTGTIRGRAVLPNTDGMLTPGMFGRLRLAVSENEETLLVPQSAIGSDQTAKFVWVVDGTGQVSRRVVTLGGIEGAMRIITGGLTAGERVVTSGLHVLAEGAEVDARAPALEVATR